MSPLSWILGEINGFRDATDAPIMIREDAVRLVSAFFLALMAAGLMVSVGILAHLRARPVNWADRVQELGRRPWTWNHAVGAAFALICLHALIIGGVRWFSSSAAGVEAGVLMVAQTLVFHWAILALVVVSLVRRRLSSREAFGWELRRLPRDLAHGFIFYLGAMPLVIFYTWLYQLVLRYLGYPPRIQEVLRILLGDAAPGLRVYFVIVGVVLAPLAEEILFRGIGLPLLLRRMGALPAVTLLSLFFAVLHFHVPAIMPLFLISAAFSIAYLYSGSIVVPIVMHALFNAVNLGIMRALSG